MQGHRGTAVQGHSSRGVVLVDIWLPLHAHVIQPVAGWGIRAETQLAGLGPDTNLLRFVKQHLSGKVRNAQAQGAQLQGLTQAGARAAPAPTNANLGWLWLQMAFPISGQTTLTLSAEAGVLLPWGAKAWAIPTTISDRFFLGGVGSLRGFAFKGVGPSDGRRRGGGDGGGDEEGDGGGGDGGEQRVRGQQQWRR